MSIPHIPEDGFRKSVRSVNDNCVELGSSAGVVVVRDSKSKAGPRLGFTAAAFTDFAQRVKSGRFDL